MGSVGRRPAGMGNGGNSINAGGFKTPLQFIGKEEIGQLAQSISSLFAVALLCIQIVEVNFAHPMARTADRNNARFGGTGDEVE